MTKGGEPSPRDRLIVALDPPYGDAGFEYGSGKHFEDELFQETASIISELGDAVSFYKVGLRLFPVFGRVVECLRKKGKYIFLDLKALDIPETVAQVATVAAHLDVEFMTMNHGSDQTVRAAKEAISKLKKSRPKILLVPFLTSLSEEDLKELYHVDVTVQEFVLQVSEKAKKAGCDGIVCSGREAGAVKKRLGGRDGKDIVVVTPGVRPEITLVRNDDQKRVVTPRKAIQEGADFIVVGRPVIRAGDKKRQVAEAVAKEIEEGLSARRAG
ncbi:MAG: orotidine-5'-phosphate decarboxylase [Acidobacteriota bacterium]|nr:MAG: orotidine-5'-phosphate decarboxylase [Acidobacteriota bacterium]